MNKHFFLLLITLLNATGIVLAQGTSVSGIVVDESSGEPLPFVNILALPTAEGSTTDIDGNFRFYSEKKVKNFSFSYLGYETKVVSINDFLNGTIEVTLKENDIMIDEAIVVAKKNKKIPKDTAAISLQQLVVDNKENNRPKSYDSYHYKEHNKIRYDFYKLKEKFTKRKILQPVRVAFDYIDTTEYNYAYLPLLLQEEISHYHYNKDPEKSKTILEARYLTGIQNLRRRKII